MATTKLTGTLLRDRTVPTVALGGGVVSGSAQVASLLPASTVSSSTQLPAGTVSASAQVISLLPASTVSSSAQLPAGTVSASAQVISLLPEGAVSSSTQLPAGTVSASGQVTSLLPVDTVSSSTQVAIASIAGTTFANAAFTFPNNVTVSGDLTAKQIYTVNVSSSVIYQSGSTKFGDTNDDVMSITGSLSLLSVSGSGATFGGLSTFNASSIEKTTVSASQATGTINFDVLTQPILYYTGSATANHTINFRGNPSNTLNSIMSTGQTLTVAYINANGATAYSASVYQVDGASITPKWQGGTSGSGNALSWDVYSYSFTKTANASFLFLASVSQYK